MDARLPHLSRRADICKPFLAMEVLERARELERQGVHVVHLEVGEPDFDAPQCVTEAAEKALHDGQTHYTHSMGSVLLREAICEHYLSRYGVTIHPDQIIVTSGTSPALFLVFSVLVEAGDQIIISDPHYAGYPNFIRFFDGEPVPVTVRESENFQYTPGAIAEKLTPHTRGIMINSPSNPTGTTLDVARMKVIADMGVPVISDEIYHGLTYTGEEHSILEFTDNAFVFNGFSKTYAMTGLRLGYLIAPKPYMRAMQTIQQNFFISANSVAQIAGVTALQHAGPDVLRMRQEYNTRRLLMLSKLRAMGFSLAHEPAGTFYLFVNAAHIDPDSFRLAFDILEKAHVGVTPGIDFGPGGEGYLRFSYAASQAAITDGMTRLAAYLEKRSSR